MADWPHQSRAVQETWEAVQRGVKRICLTSPTGGGKTEIAQRIIDWGLPTVFYVNRNLLLEQTAQRLSDYDFGIQAAGHLPVHGDRLQLASIQTVDRRWRSGRQELHDAKIVLIDEWHNEKAERSQRILGEHIKRGATVIGLTATPVGLGGIADHLIVAGTNSELRACGALVPAKTFAPNEPDIRAFKGRTKGLLQFKDEYREVMLPVILGSAIEWYRRVNPERRPSVLFAPGVPESRWFSEEFTKAGFPGSHIDGQMLLLNGEEMPANAANRELLRRAIVSGETLGVSNRFVLREGINIPEISHCIFCCTFGSLVAYLQSGGRVLRSCDGKPYATIVDHGGNYYRWFSLNDDRIWSLDDTDESVRAKIAEDFRSKKAEEPSVCPKCAKGRHSGATCPHCGFTYKAKRRVVIQVDGELREMYGDIYRPRKVATTTAHEKLWEECFWRCRKTGKTFNQARGLFAKLSQGHEPPATFRNIPLDHSDWSMKIIDVPFNRLNCPPRHEQQQQPTLVEE